MARLLVSALRAGGHDVEIVSTLRSFMAAPDEARRAAIEASAEVEARSIEQAWSAGDVPMPDLWFTYHPFYKAPDLLGPRLATTFGLPYATAEASHAPKRTAGPWASWHAATETALRAAHVHFCFTDQDREGLERLLDGPQKIVALPPFIDTAPFRSVRRRPPGETIDLVTVAMMRAGDKMRSFAFLAEALRRLPADPSWRLSIIGDGPARAEVEAAFAALPPDKVLFLGQREAPAVIDALARADLYVWPGFNEAYGVSYLEAGAAGLPVLAMRCGGIGSVVRHGETGLLVPEGDIEAYASALAALIVDDALRLRLGDAARDFVTDERTVLRAAAILNGGLARMSVKMA